MAGRGMIHHGQVSERNCKNASARVAFDDLEGLVSGEMQVLFPAIGGWNCFWTPKEGDHVVMSRLPNGGQEGHILGKVYTGKKMPQGGKPNILLLVSDDAKNVVRFDADKGTLDLIVDQDGTMKFKNLDIEVTETTAHKTKNYGIEVEETTRHKTKDYDIETEETTSFKTKNYDASVEEMADIKTGDLEVEVKNHAGLKTAQLDIESDTPIGLKGTATQLGADVLQAFFDELIRLMAIRRGIPQIPWIPGVPAPPAPPLINMLVNGIVADIAAAAAKAKIACAKALK